MATPIVHPSSEVKTIDQCYQDLADSIVFETWKHYRKMRTYYEYHAGFLGRRTKSKIFYRLKRLEKFFNSGWCYELCMIDTPLFAQMIRELYGYCILDIDNSRTLAVIKKRKKPRVIERKGLRK